LLTILAAAYNCHMIAWLPGSEDAAKAVGRMPALIKKIARLTALGLMLFVCGKLIVESTSLPDILGAARGCSKQLFRCGAALKRCPRIGWCAGPT
jgi:hypothetical protein|tara:strand:- start:140 stop:424 length:285 start_codon:yes stop_codon:yes gene_type:complete